MDARSGATKAGIQASAETLRKEVADQNIKVSVIQPGSVDTDMQECSADEKRAAVASQQMLQAEEIAEAIRFVLTRGPASDIVNLRIEPRLQKTA
jgi:3-hydroxy acid dehydrogenase/malonic semialdehyde reductase